MNPKALLLALVCAGPIFAANPPAQPRPAAKPPLAEAESTSGSKEEQLAAAQKRLAILKLHHEENHPSVVKQRAKVAKLQKEARAESPVPAAGDRAAQLEAAKRDLAKLSERFTDQHPTVIAQKKRIAELERK
jgi:uncharacterized protein involved in exopolysaccharide biosynthesis